MHLLMLATLQFVVPICCDPSKMRPKQILHTVLANIYNSDMMYKTLLKCVIMMIYLHIRPIVILPAIFPSAIFNFS